MEHLKRLREQLLFKDKDEAIREYLNIENNGRHYEFVSSIQDFDRTTLQVMLRLYMDNSEEFYIADMVLKNDGSLFEYSGSTYSFAGIYNDKALFRKGMDRQLLELDLNKKIRKIF